MIKNYIFRLQNTYLCKFGGFLGRCLAGVMKFTDNEADEGNYAYYSGSVKKIMCSVEVKKIYN